MKSVLDFCFKYINQEEGQIENELSELADQVAGTVRNARRGARISKEKWDELDTRENILNHKKQILKDIYDELYKYYIPRFSYLELDNYLTIVNEILLNYEIKEDFEACIFLKKLRNQLENIKGQ